MKYAIIILVCFLIFLTGCCQKFTQTGKVIATEITGESLTTYSTKIWLDNGSNYRLWGIHLLEMNKTYTVVYRLTYPERNGDLLLIKKH